MKHEDRIVARFARQVEALTCRLRFEAWAKKVAPRRSYSVERGDWGWVVVERISEVRG